MARTIVITGAHGLVGAHLGRMLEARGDVVRAISLRAGAIAPAAVEGADAVVHLAGESVAGRWTTAKRDAILRSRTEGTRQVVEAIAGAERRPGVLISASAVGYYGDRGDETLTEGSAQGSGFLADVCDAWESEARRAEEAGVRVVRLRFGVILARDAPAFRKLLVPARLGLGGPLGNGNQWWSWIHIDDVVGLVDAALGDVRYTGPINATAPNPARQRAVAKALGSAVHRPAFLPAPAFALRAALGGFSIELLGSRRVLPARAQELGYAFGHREIESAFADLVTRR